MGPRGNSTSIWALVGQDASWRRVIVPDCHKNSALNWAAAQQTNKMSCEPSEDSDQTGQISLCCPQKETLEPLASYWAHNEDSDQTARMLRLIWVFAGRTCHFSGFVVLWLNFVFANCAFSNFRWDTTQKGAGVNYRMWLMESTSGFHCHFPLERKEKKKKLPADKSIKRLLVSYAHSKD